MERPDLAAFHPKSPTFRLPEGSNYSRLKNLATLTGCEDRRQDRNQSEIGTSSGHTIPNFILFMRSYALLLMPLVGQRQAVVFEPLNDGLRGDSGVLGVHPPRSE
jgi:hypothetical protein